MASGAASSSPRYFSPDSLLSLRSRFSSVRYFSSLSRSASSARPRPELSLLDDPTRGCGDQQAQNSSEDQDRFGLGQAPLRVRVAQRQQAHLFVLHLANRALKLVHDPLPRSASNGIRCRLQTLGPAQANDHL